MATFLNRYKYILVLLILSHTSLAQTIRLTAQLTSGADTSFSGEAFVFSVKDLAPVKLHAFKTRFLSIDSLMPGEFLLKLILLSHKDTSIYIQLDTSKPLVDLGTISLQKTNQLNEVVVNGKLPTFQSTAQGTKINIENSILAASASAQELLGKMPGISLSSNRVNVFGRGEALIYLNGKQIPYEQFSSLSVNRIKSIEIITNPSAKFDARGRSVIVVTLKPNTQEGWQGVLTQNSSWGRHYLNTSSLNLNYRKKKLSCSADYGLNLGTDWNNNIYSTEFNLPSGTYRTDSYYQEDSKSTQVSNYRMGAAYELNSKSNISAQYDGLNTVFDLAVQNRSDNFNPTGEKTGININNKASTKNLNHSFNLNYNLNLDTLGSSLFSGIQYNNFLTRLHDEIQEKITPTHGSEVNALRVNDGKNIISIYAAQLDIVKVLKHDFKLETGAKYAKVSNLGKVNIKTRFDSSDVWYDYSQYANNFIYTEEVPALYFLLSGKEKNLEYSIGSRAEYSKISGFSKKLNAYIIDSSYFNIFPNARVTYNINKNWVSGASYGMKINRPLYQDLDPFLWYIDSLTSITGNSRLIPELNHQTEATLNYKNYGLRFGYTYSKNAIRSILRQGNTGVNSRVYIKENLQQFSQWNVTLDIPIEKKYFNSYNSFAINLNALKDNRQELVFKKITPQFYIYSMNEMNVKDYFTLNLNGEYYSGNIDGFVQRQPMYYLSFGASKQFFGKKLFCQLLYNDFLRTYRFAGTRKIAGITSVYNQHINSHFFRIVLTYKFGRLKNVSYNNKAVNEAEFNRIKQ